METLILIRHGNYDDTEDDNGPLTEAGREKIVRLVDKLKPLAGGRRLLILSSPSKRAQESAEILAAAFGISFEKHKVLWSDESHFEDMPAALELVRRRQAEADILILVTHREYIADFPPYFFEQEFGIKISWHIIGKGEAWVIDCERRTLLHIS